jgi:REP element-mobilizing transposase RayT
VAFVPENTAEFKMRRRQLDLGLGASVGWGGRREGAGRKPARRRRVPHGRRPSFLARHPCHVTVRIRPGMPSLRCRRLVRELERSFREARERGRFRLLHYSIQTNHLHLLVEANDARALSHGMRSVGARIARAVNRTFRRRGPVLDDRYHARALRTPTEVRRALAYVLQNARRHLAKLGRALPPADWMDPASSGRWFDGWRRPLPPARDPPAIAAPRTWLAAVGWRRRGLIVAGEVPGRAR